MQEIKPWHPTPPCITMVEVPQDPELVSDCHILAGSSHAGGRPGPGLNINQPGPRARDQPKEVRMNYQQKMVQHIEAAERWQAEVERLEGAAERRALVAIAERSTFKGFGRRRGHSSKITASAVAKQVILVHMKEILDGSITYKSAVANRNGHQEQAQMYALAALAQLGQWS